MRKINTLLSLADRYSLKRGTKFREFSRQEIYDEDLADDIKKGSYPDLKVKKLKNGKYVFSRKRDPEN